MAHEGVSFMRSENPTRRPYGTGELYTRVDQRSRETWYGRWYDENGQRVKRAIGPKGTGGLTRTQAEAEMRRRMAPDPAKPVRRHPTVAQRPTLSTVEQRYRAHLQAKNRKRSTIAAVESCMRVWWLPLYGERTLDAIRAEDVESAIVMMEAGRRPGAVKRTRSCGPKTIVNYVGILGAVYHYAQHTRRRWAAANPCDDVDLPELEDNVDIRFLDPAECDALTAAAMLGVYHDVDTAFYITAPRTGLRHGEMNALRWRDIDWTAMRIRVRQNHVLGEFDTPKSRRSTRSVPMSPEVGGALERLFQQSRYQRDHDLVFADPRTGEPLSKASNNRRYRRALAAARLDATHTIHDLRHTFGTRMAAVGVPMRTVQEWMGHRDIKTTQRYADYAPRHDEAELVARAFARGPIGGPNLTEPQGISEHPSPVNMGDRIGQN
jgi:integrase